MPPSRRRDRIAATAPARAARKAWPVVLAAYRRWEALPPAEKERYRKMASKYARRGQETLARRRKR
jgi:hypothetical protein